MANHKPSRDKTFKRIEWTIFGGLTLVPALFVLIVISAFINWPINVLIAIGAWIAMATSLKYWAWKKVA